MADAKRLVRPAISVVLLGATALGLMNTFGDNREVVAMAEKAACGKDGCAVQMVREARNPFAQSYSFQLDRETQKVAHVSCRRAWVLLGPYACAPE